MESEHSQSSDSSLDGHSENTFLRSSTHGSETTAATVVSEQTQSCPLVIYPENASAFAAVWDPEYEVVAFGGVTLFDSRDGRNAGTSQCMQPADLLTDAHDDHHTSTFAVYQDVLKDTFKPILNTPQRFRHNHSHTMASSTRGGFDLYTRDSVLPADQKSIVYFSCMDQLDDDLAFDARLAFTLEQSLEADLDSVSDEGFFEQGQGQDQAFRLKSHFSTTTTSTSNYVEVARLIQDFDAESMASIAWSTLERPDDYDTFSTPNSTPRRRLRKRRPSHQESPVPSSTSERFTTSPTPSDKTIYTSLVQRLPALPKFKKDSSLDEQWVCIDVTQTITQRLV